VSVLIGVYGAAGCGRCIMPIVRTQYPASSYVFVDDMPGLNDVNGHEVIGWHSFLTYPVQNKCISIAVASPAIRKNLADKCDLAEIQLVEVRATSVVQWDNVSIGRGACLSPFVTLTSNISIGQCFHANLYSYVEHDCKVGDFVTLAPGAKLNGNVSVGDFSFVGSGAVIHQGISIGESAIVGMGSVVIDDVPSGVTVAGNPARIISKG